MDKLPFTVYDFFACLSSGLVLLAGIAAAFMGSDGWARTPSTVVSLVLVVVVYAAGHLVANVSGFLYERLAVRGWLGAPTRNLMAEEPAGGVSARLFPGFHGRLPEGLRRRIHSRASASGIGESAEELFMAAFAAVRSDALTYTRLSTFLNLYGFCRNVSLASLIAAVALAAGSLAGTAYTGTLITPGWWALGAFVIALGLFYRYLKFYRLYACEVLAAYGA